MKLRPYQTWIIHWLIAIAISLAGALTFGNIGWLVGSTLAFLFYAHREYKDMQKYRRQGTWNEYHLSDGVGDLIGPFALWIGAIGAFLF